MLNSKDAKNVIKRHDVQHFFAEKCGAKKGTFELDKIEYIGSTKIGEFYFKVQFEFAKNGDHLARYKTVSVSINDGKYLVKFSSSLSYGNRGIETFEIKEA